MRAVTIALVLTALACSTKRAEVISLGPGHDASPAADDSGDRGDGGGPAEEVGSGDSGGPAKEVGSGDGGDSGGPAEEVGGGDSGGPAEEVGSGGSGDGGPETGGADLGAAPEAAVEAAIAPEAAIDGGGCTTLPNTAPVVPVTTGDDTVATGVGGTVAAGTYYLTSVVRTPSSIMPQMTFHQTLRISGNTIESVAQDNDKPANNGVTAFTTSGSSIVFTSVCSTQTGSGGDLHYDSYTADDSHLILYAVGIGITVTFTRQD